MGENKVRKGTAPGAKRSTRNTHVLGRSFMFPPEVIDDIHIKS